MCYVFGITYIYMDISKPRRAFDVIDMGREAFQRFHRHEQRKTAGAHPLKDAPLPLKFTVPGARRTYLPQPLLRSCRTDSSAIAHMRPSRHCISTFLRKFFLSEKIPSFPCRVCPSPERLVYGLPKKRCQCCGNRCKTRH